MHLAQHWIRMDFHGSFTTSSIGAGVTRCNALKRGILRVVGTTDGFLHIYRAQLPASFLAYLSMVTVGSCLSRMNLACQSVSFRTTSQMTTASFKPILRLGIQTYSGHFLILTYATLFLDCNTSFVLCGTKSF
ncbi:hypothetical protein BJV74DRAFT_874106 [Russula compacta]|nr:hypothetical protein BJV74DRAFT_874106 [Russula compacta]